VGRCEYRSWRYDRFEPLILTALWKQVDWTKAVPRTKEQARQAAADIEERKATLELEAEKVSKQLERVADALMDAPKSETLMTRLQNLEQRKSEVTTELRRLGDSLETEREKLRTASAATKEVLGAFAQWMNEPQDHDSRMRVAAALRETVREMRLHKGPRGSDDGNVVEVVLRNGADPLRVPVALLEKLDKTTEAATLRRLRIPTAE
jgi:hypothetical protein